MHKGDLQSGCLDTCKRINPVLSKIIKLEKKKKSALVKANMPMMVSYGKSFFQMVQLFGYEEYYNSAYEIFEFWESVEKDKDRLESNTGKFNQVLDNMVKIAETLIRNKDGKKKFCVCCEEEVYYMPLSKYYDNEAKKHNAHPHTAETLSLEEYTCPVCYSSDRDRMIIHFLKKLELDKGYYKEKLLQIAPAKAIEHWIYGNCPSLIYNSTDLYMEDVSFTSDIQNMTSVENESYDYIICSHVLEYVQDDKKAMKEMYRILKQDGFCIFLVPIAIDMDGIDEEWGLSEEENWRRFGLGDHCRIYGRLGLMERLNDAGFTVHVLDKKYFGDDIFRQTGLCDTSVLYVLTKQYENIDDLVKSKIESRNNLKEGKPLVSVIMSAYNHEKYVGRAIESVLNQTYSNIEFLVADDCSSDGTVDEILKYEDRIDEIHLFDKNAMGRIIFLCTRAKGKYIAVINSDDFWKEEKIEMQVKYLENNPKCAACFTGGICIDSNEKEMDFQIFIGENKSREKWMRHFFNYGNCLAHPSVLIKRKVYSELVKGVSTFRQLPDFWVWVKLIQKYDIHVIEKSMIYFTFHEDEKFQNTSARTVENSIRQMNEETYLWYKVIKEMDSVFFVNTFKEDLVNKEVSDIREIMCEKFLILKNSNKHYIKQSALIYLYDICAEYDEIYNILSEIYNFTFLDIFDLSKSFVVSQV